VFAHRLSSAGLVDASGSYATPNGMLRGPERIAITRVPWATAPFAAEQVAPPAKLLVLQAHSAGASCAGLPKRRPLCRPS
jgi:hypothetical protein